jgi:hypothetical protein
VEQYNRGGDMVIESKVCESCGKVMEKFSPLNGKEYKICLECARKLPDPLQDEDILSD